MLKKITEAIAFIHKRGVAHRDIKLENIMLEKVEGSSEFEPKLVDFGLSGVFVQGEKS